MIRHSRIRDAFPDEQAFLAALRAAVAGFAYRRVESADGSYTLQPPGHTACVRFPPSRRRRLFGGAEAAYEAPTMAVLSFLARTFDLRLFYDVGASGGFFAIMAGSTEGGRVSAHAFEMQPDHHELMLRTLDEHPDLKPRVHAHLAGMSDRHEGRRDIWFSRTHMFEKEPPPAAYREAWWRRLKFWLRGVKDRDRLVRASVLVTSIDHFAAQEGAAPDFIKIDVDGYEALVLPGAMETLRAHRPFLLLELHKDQLLERFGKTRRDVVAPLFGCGYSAALIEDHNEATSKLTPVTLDSPVMGQQATNMFLFY
jgi:FkbM family methyltransferase